MQEAMSTPTWNEYLRDAKKHLEAAKVAAATGGAPPELPVRPVESIPEELIEEARLLSICYDELALEVAERMDNLRLQSQQFRRGPHKEQASANYVDTVA